MDSAVDDYTKLGNKLLEAIRPGSFLCIGSGCEGVIGSPFAPEDSLCLTAEHALAGLSQLGRFDFALVCGALEQLPKTQAGQLLARLRDLHGGRFAVVIRPGQSPWRDAELLAMGLVRAQHDGTALYLFDIRTYKHIPDWLNPRFWANPERWDKHWW